MTTPSVFHKLNLKDQTEIVVVNAPASFEPELAALAGVSVVRDARAAKAIAFAIAFTITQKEVDAAAKALTANAAGDAVLWFAYPKGSSKKYTCEFNRDTGWAALAAAGYEPVRQVAIDEDWSALRFRKVEHIKTMTRSFAATEAGKAKAKPKRNLRESA
ncbi:MAG: hypothetical protein IPO29_18610 [Anaerolineae bacterium]|nr:hypothetical protein [Anaerolineae bacterium]